MLLITRFSFKRTPIFLHYLKKKNVWLVPSTAKNDERDGDLAEKICF